MTEHNTSGGLTERQVQDIAVTIAALLAGRCDGQQAVATTVAQVDHILADRLAAVQAERDVHRQAAGSWHAQARADKARAESAEAENARLRERLGAVEVLDVAALLSAHHWGDDTAIVGYVAMQCGCGWKSTDATSRIYDLRARHDQHRAEVLRAALDSPTSHTQQEAEVGARVTIPAHHLVGMDLGFTCTNCGGHTSTTAPCIPARDVEWARADALAADTGSAEG